jgi:hypothetical protein
VQISTLLGNSERTLRHITDFEAEIAILAEVADGTRGPRAIAEPRLKASVGQAHLDKLQQNILAGGLGLSAKGSVSGPLCSETGLT